jgi:hypothetical protein
VNNGISARIDRKATHRPPRIVRKAEISFMHFQCVKIFQPLFYLKAKNAGSVQTDAMIAGLYVFIPNGEGEYLTPS